MVPLDRLTGSQILEEPDVALMPGAEVHGRFALGGGPAAHNAEPERWPSCVGEADRRAVTSWHVHGA